MSCTIIEFPAPERNIGNGAREALINVALDLPNTSQTDAEKWADWILASLWERGFLVKPLPDGAG